MRSGKPVLAWRLRKCSGCGHRFTTTEGYDQASSDVEALRNLAMSLLRLSADISSAVNELRPQVDPTATQPSRKQSACAGSRTRTRLAPPSEPDRRWCDQCERRVASLEASRCKDRFCSLKEVA